MRMMSFETEYITFLLLVVLTIILFVTAAWFVARRKYKDYVKVKTVQEIQESIDCLNQITKEEREELEKTLKLEAEIATLKTKIYFLSKYNCLNINCPKRNKDKELIEWTEDDSKDVII